MLQQPTGRANPSGPDFGEGPDPGAVTLASSQHCLLGPYTLRIAFVAIAVMSTPGVGLLAVYPVVSNAGPGKRSDPLCRPYRRIVGITVP